MRAITFYIRAVYPFVARYFRGAGCAIYAKSIWIEGDSDMAQVPEKPKLTPMQEKFVELVANGVLSATQCAIEAGFSEKSADAIASQLKRLPNVQEAIRNARSVLLGTELAPLALRTLGEVLRDKSAKPGDRVRAAAVVLERTAKHEETLPVTTKDPSQMSVNELEGYIREAESRLVDVTPRQPDAQPIDKTE